MQKILRVLLVLALVGAVIGYFRNWYTVTRTDEEQQTDIHVKINRQRIKEDLDSATEKARRVAGQAPSDSDVPPTPEDNGLAPPWPR